MLKNTQKDENILFDIFQFQKLDNLRRALTHKIQEIEDFQKKSRTSHIGNNEEWAMLGHSILEFLFVDYMISIGYPDSESNIKKHSDILRVRQQLFTDLNFSELAVMIKLNDVLKTGKQTMLKSNPKVLGEAFKALIAAQYMDKDQDIEQVKELVKPFLTLLLQKFQGEIPIPKNSYKSQFYELFNKIPSIEPKISYICKFVQTTDQISSKMIEFTYTLEISNSYKEKKTGFNKKETEERLFQQFLEKVPDLEFDGYTLEQRLSELDLSSSSDITNSFNQSYMGTFLEKYLADESNNSTV